MPLEELDLIYWAGVGVLLDAVRLDGAVPRWGSVWGQEAVKRAQVVDVTAELGCGG